MMASQSGNNDAGSSGPGISSELRARDLPSKRVLGKGLASIVYETEWNGERFARKDFIGVPSGAFQKEAAILVGLKDHENVVKTHARTVDKMSCSLVLEYMEENLLDVLQKRKESQREASGTASGSRCEENPSYPFELAEALAILSQIARGMEFLHEQNIPHGDLKTKNVLVSHINDGEKNVLSVKVADFGLVRTKSKSMSFVSRQARKLDVVQWKAPEVLERLLSEDNDVTTSESDSNSETERTGSLGVSERLGADVYSFAVTCSQILTGEGPYPNGNWKELGSKIVSGELRPNLPAVCPGLLKCLLESCWTKSLARRPTFSFIRELLDFWLVDPEISKLKLLNTPSGNGGPKGDHHVAADQAREIVRQAVVAVTEAGAGKQQQSSAVKKGTVRYRECQKNHAASIGGHAIDGCGEFMPGGEDGSVDALRCAACDCHRNFHRREVEDEIVCDCKKLKRKFLSNPQLSQAPGMTANTTTTTCKLALPWSQQLGQMTPLTMAALSAGGGPTDSDEPDDESADHMMMSVRSPSAIKKRFRTKFTTEQKDQMCAFAEKVGWRIQKQDEAAVQEFCTTVGVKRHVLKVWMHSNKHTMWKSKP